MGFLLLFLGKQNGLRRNAETRFAQWVCFRCVSFAEAEAWRDLFRRAERDSRQAPVKRCLAHRCEA